MHPPPSLPAYLGSLHELSTTFHVIEFVIAVTFLEKEAHKAVKLHREVLSYQSEASGGVVTMFDKLSEHDRVPGTVNTPAN